MANSHHTSHTSLLSSSVDNEKTTRLIDILTQPASRKRSAEITVKGPAQKKIGQSIPPLGPLLTSSPAPSLLVKFRIPTPKLRSFTMSKEVAGLPPTMAEHISMRSEKLLGSHHDLIYTYPLDEIYIKPPWSPSSSPSHSSAGSSIIEEHDTEWSDVQENFNNNDLSSLSPFKTD